MSASGKANSGVYKGEWAATWAWAPSLCEWSWSLSRPLLHTTLDEETRWMNITSRPHAVDQTPDLWKASGAEGGSRERTALAAWGKMAERSRRRRWEPNLGTSWIHRRTLSLGSKDTCRPKNATSPCSRPAPVSSCCFVWGGSRCRCLDAAPAGGMSAASAAILGGRGGTGSRGPCSPSAPSTRRAGRTWMSTYPQGRKERPRPACTLASGAGWNRASITPCARGMDLKFMFTRSRKGRRCQRVTRTSWPPSRDPGFIHLILSRHVCLSWVWTLWTGTSCHHSMCTI